MCHLLAAVYSHFLCKTRILTLKTAVTRPKEGFQHFQGFQKYEKNKIIKQNFNIAKHISSPLEVLHLSQSGLSNILGTFKSIRKT